MLCAGAQKKEGGAIHPLCSRLVVFRVHGGPAADFVADEPQLRGNGIDVPDFAPVAGIALCESDLGGEETPESAAEIPVVERLCCGLGKRLQVIVEVPGHPVDWTPAESDVGELGEIDESSVLYRVGVGVDADRLPEHLFRRDVFLKVWKIFHK
jgi:hypothetical protein